MIYNYKINQKGSKWQLIWIFTSDPRQQDWICG